MDFEYWDENGTGITEDEAFEAYDEMLDSVYDEVTVGSSTWSPSEILREMDPIAYNCGFLDYEDSQLEEGVWLSEEPEEEEDDEEIDWEKYWDDFNKGLNGGLADPSHPNNN